MNKTAAAIALLITIVVMTPIALLLGLLAAPVWVVVLMGLCVGSFVGWLSVGIAMD